MIEERPGYYSIIPASVRYDKTLKPNEKLLYSEISVLCNKTGYCYATNEYFAKLYDVHRNTISIWINNLKNQGYIGTKIVYKEGSKEIDKRMLFLSDVVLREIAELYCKNHKEGINDFVDRYLRNHVDPINENLKENNTSNNNSTTTNNNTSLDIFEVIEENFGRTLNSLEYEKINQWNEYNFSLDLLKYAVEKAVLKNIYNISYIDKILYEWNKNNIRTVAQAQKSDEEHANRKEQKKSIRSFFKRETEDERYRRQLKEAEEYDKQEALRNEQS